MSVHAKAKGKESSLFKNCISVKTPWGGLSLSMCLLIIPVEISSLHFHLHGDLQGMRDKSCKIVLTKDSWQIWNSSLSPILILKIVVYLPPEQLQIPVCIIFYHW